MDRKVFPLVGVNLTAISIRQGILLSTSRNLWARIAVVQHNAPLLTSFFAFPRLIVETIEASWSSHFIDMMFARFLLGAIKLVPKFFIVVDSC